MSGAHRQPIPWAKLLERAREGDDTALQELLTHLQPLILHGARRLGRVDEDAKADIEAAIIEAIRRGRPLSSP